MPHICLFKFPFLLAFRAPQSNVAFNLERNFFIPLDSFSSAIRIYCIALSRFTTGVIRCTRLLVLMAATTGDVKVHLQEKLRKCRRHKSWLFSSPSPTLLIIYFPICVSNFSFFQSRPKIINFNGFFYLKTFFCCDRQQKPPCSHQDKKYVGERKNRWKLMLRWAQLSPMMWRCDVFFPPWHFMHKQKSSPPQPPPMARTRLTFSLFDWVSRMLWKEILCFRHGRE